MDLKGTKTEKNLMEAFAGESQARNKYTFFASKAKVNVVATLIVSGIVNGKSIIADWMPSENTESAIATNVSPIFTVTSNETRSVSEEIIDW